MPRTTNEDVLDMIRRVAHAPRVFCVRRPIHIVDRVAGKPEVVEERPHLDVLIDSVTGGRSVLQKLRDPAKIEKWHRVAERDTTQVLDSTLTCTWQQLPVFLDPHSKHIYAFGGNQSGKTQVGAEFLWDRMLENAGLYLWLAPTLEKTQVGVEKLTRTTKFAKQIIPKELVSYAPPTERAGDQNIRLIDPNVVSLRYCSREGDNIKGITGVLAAAMDEGTSVQHEINYTIATNRLLMAGGQMIIPTTPVKGHWLEHKNSETKTYAEIEQHVEHGHERPPAAKVVLSCFDNPWIPDGEVARTIESLGGKDDPRVRREVFGEWIRDGNQLWTHFNEERHTVNWGSPDVERYGYVDVTSIVGRSLFRGMTQTKNFNWIGGQDYNFNPYSLTLCKFICKRDADHGDPENWIVYVPDSIVKRAKSTAEFGDWLATQAGAWNGRGLGGKAFAGLHIIGDGQGFYRNRDMRENVGTDAEEMKRAGFVVRAPRYTTTNKRPANPPRAVRIGWMNDLFYRNKILINNAQIGESTRNSELIESLSTATDAKPKPGSAADRKAGVTDGLGYPVYAALYHRRKPAANSDAPGISAAGWG